MTATRLVKRLIVMGPPGSGKGTVSARIQKTFGSFHLSSGDLLRAEIAAGTDAGKVAESFISRGSLVPDETIVGLIVDALKKQEERMSSGSWILDGFPRTASQASSLQASLPVDFVVNLDVPAAVIVERVKGRWVHLPSGRVYNEDWNPPKEPGKDDVTGEPLSKRPDDVPETVARRLAAYEEQTRPLLDFYRRLGGGRGRGGAAGEEGDEAEGILRNFRGTETNVIWPRVERFLEGVLREERRAMG